VVIGPLIVAGWVAAAGGAEVFGGSGGGGEERGFGGFGGVPSVAAARWQLVTVRQIFPPQNNRLSS